MTMEVISLLTQLTQALTVSCSVIRNAWWIGEVMAFILQLT